MKHVVSAKWLLARLYEPDLVIVDCRFLLSDPAAGRRQYTESYIPGAVYMDLEQDLSGRIGTHGGRHPLPDIDNLAGKLGRVGIDSSVRVVIYDDQGTAMASRLWWLLTYMGHEQAYVLDGGFSAWKQAGYPLTSAKPPIRVPKTFVPRLQPERLADMDEVKQEAGRDDVMLIDSRESPRYLGVTEPIDRIAGHIPSAVNRFWKDNLYADGTWKPRELLRERFPSGEDAPHRKIIVYCGSGVTACPNILALTEAGFANVKLYAGSWSDWISYEGNPVATGEEGKA